MSKFRKSPWEDCKTIEEECGASKEHYGGHPSQGQRKDANREVKSLRFLQNMLYSFAVDSY